MWVEWMVSCLVLSYLVFCTHMFVCCLDVSSEGEEFFWCVCGRGLGVSGCV